MSNSELVSTMLKRLQCWWHGHMIVATIEFGRDRMKHVFMCQRCNRVLPGPR